MQVVIDTVCIHHLTRPSKPSYKLKNEATFTKLKTPLDKPLRLRKLSLAVDIEGGLVDEWKRTCGEEYIEALIIKWADLDGIDPVDPAPSIGYPHTRALKQFGFSGTVDKLILRIALVTNDKNVVSDDSDFWDPAQPTKRGSPSACVAQYCNNNLGITIMLLSTLLRCF